MKFMKAFFTKKLKTIGADVYDVTDCSGCGGNHSILFIPMKQKDDSGYTHKGVCMKKRKVILMKSTI